jgi:hypothetical protein
MIAVSLSDFEALEFASVLFELSSELIDTFSLEPVFTPLSEVHRFKWLVFIVANLHASNEIFELRIGPLMALEIDSEPRAESFPLHQVDELLDHARALAIGDTVDQRLSFVSRGAIALDTVI